MDAPVCSLQDLARVGSTEGSKTITPSSHGVGPPLINFRFGEPKIPVLAILFAAAELGNNPPLVSKGEAILHKTAEDKPPCFRSIREIGRGYIQVESLSWQLESRHASLLQEHG